MTAPPVEYPTEPCRSCGKPVIWAISTRLNPMPVNPEPSADGNIQLEPRGDGRQPIARVLKVADRFGKTGLRTSHFTDCPQSGQWRRRKAKTP